MTEIDKKIYSKKNINFLFFSKNKENKNSLVVFGNFINPDKILLFFIHPISQIEYKSPKISDYSQIQVQSALENILQEKIDYLIHLNSNNFTRLLNIIGGLKLCLDPNSLRVSDSYERKLGEKLYSGPDLSDYLYYQQNDEKKSDYYIKKILRQESVFLTFFEKVTIKNKVSDSILEIIFSFLEMNMNFKEFKILYSFILKNDLDLFIYEVPGSLIENEKNFTLEIQSKNFKSFYDNIKNKAKLNFLQKDLIKVEVLNGTKIPKLAKKFSERLLYNKKIKIYNISNAWSDSQKESMIINRIGKIKVTQYLRQNFNIKKDCYILQKDLGVDATVVLGGEK